MNWTDTQESGLYERFYSNGQLMIRQNYEDGELHAEDRRHGGRDGQQVHEN